MNNQNPFTTQRRNLRFLDKPFINVETEAKKFKDIVFANGMNRLNVFIYAGCHGIEDFGHVWAVFPNYGEFFDLTGFAEECSKGPNV